MGGGGDQGHRGAYAGFSVLGAWHDGDLGRVHKMPGSVQKLGLNARNPPLQRYWKLSHLWTESTAMRWPRRAPPRPGAPAREVVYRPDWRAATYRCAACSKPLFDVDAPARRQRCLAHDLGEVLVEEHASDERLSRGDAELLVEALGVVLDGVRGDDEGLGHLGTGEATGEACSVTQPSLLGTVTSTLTRCPRG